MKTAITAAIGFTAIAAIGSMPEVRDVTMTQDETTKMVTVTYVVTNGPAIVTFDVTTNGVSIGLDKTWCVSGGINRRFKDGEYSFKWCPLRSWRNVRIADPSLNLKAALRVWPEFNPPDYMVVSASTYSNVWHYAAPEALPGGTGVTNVLYKTDFIVMRRIHARNRPWRMGSTAKERENYPGNRETPHMVTFTNDYYIGVFEVTQDQLLGFYPGFSDDSTIQSHLARHLPASAKYNELRGSTGDNIDWPSTGHSVKSSSMLGCLRTMTGVEFDLPTDAQWEYACRAGSALTYCYGTTVSRYLADYAWYDGSSGVSSDSTKENYYATFRPWAFPVGLKKPNVWGLYDMHGNVHDWCLDWARDILPADPVVEPVGPSSASDAITSGGNPTGSRCYRGGTYYQGATMCKSAYRNYDPPTSRSAVFGFRLACPCPADTTSLE